MVSESPLHHQQNKGGRIMLIRLCDKCNKEIKPEDDAAYLQIAVKGLCSTSKYFDLCMDCYKEFLNEFKR